MWSHTPSLEYLVIACTIAPAALVRVAAAFGGPAVPSAVPAARAVRLARVGVPASYLLVTVLALIVAGTGGFLPGYLTTAPEEWVWPVLAVAVGFGVLAAELAAAVLPEMVRGARRVRIGVDPSFGSAGPGHLTAVLVTAVAEEILYRGLWIGILYQVLELPAAVAIGSSAVAFGLGHLFFGTRQLVHKTLTGVVYGVLLVASGDLLVPIVAHLSQNLIVFWMAARQEVRS